jgi:hypothetical protein
MLPFGPDELSGDNHSRSASTTHRGPCEQDDASRRQPVPRFWTRSIVQAGTQSIVALLRNRPSAPEPAQRKVAGPHPAVRSNACSVRPRLIRSPHDRAALDSALRCCRRSRVRRADHAGGWIRSG